MEEDLFSRLERRPVPKAKKQFTINVPQAQIQKPVELGVNIQDLTSQKLFDRKDFEARLKAREAPSGSQVASSQDVVEPPLDPFAATSAPGASESAVDQGQSMKIKTKRKKPPPLGSIKVDESGPAPLGPATLESAQLEPAASASAAIEPAKPVTLKVKGKIDRRLVLKPGVKSILSKGTITGKPQFYDIQKTRKTKAPDFETLPIDSESQIEIGKTIAKRLPPPSKAITVLTPRFYLNNREKFIDFMDRLFSRYTDQLAAEEKDITCANRGGEEFSLLTHQQIIRDYINLYTPYRGLLLYHGLGAGKTCGSIGIAEGFRESKQIIVMTPASLRTNYIEEIKKCGDLLYKKNQYWEFVSVGDNLELINSLAKALNLSPRYVQQNKGAWLVNAKKPSNFQQLSQQEKQNLDHQLDEMIAHKYQFINYNGLQQRHMQSLTQDGTINPFDDKVVIIDEAHNLISRIVNKLKKKSGSLSLVLYHHLMEAKNCRIILLTGTPMINYPNEIGVLFNILRGKIRTWSIKLQMRTGNKLDEAALRKILKDVKTLDYMSFNVQTGMLTVTKNPLGFTSGYSSSGQYQGVQKKDKESSEDTIEGFFARITKVLGRNGIEVVPSTEENSYVALPDDLDSFMTYFVNGGDSSMKNKNLFQRRIIGLTSYFRSAQEQLMPKYDADAGDYQIINIDMSDFQFGVYETARVAERKLEKRNAKKAKAAAAGEIFDDSVSTYRIFSRAFCNFVFPREIGRPMPGGEDQVDDTGSMIEKVLEETADQDILDAANTETMLKAVDGEFTPRNEFLEDQGDEPLKTPEAAKYETRIQKALTMLKENSNKFLTPEGLTTFSPKFLNILENIRDPEHIGLHLIYSQFRTLEGIGILKLVLEQNGFIHFKIVKNSSGQWMIDIPMEDRGKPSFILYTGTETSEEKELLRNIFNSTWDYLPPSLVAELKAINMNNYYGELIKVIMLTAAGAEGITLKNVRYVHLTEPYWHPVRTEQVIGRARRICSHEDLDPQYRTVQVMLYLMKFSQEQLEADESIELRLNDVSKFDGKSPVTSDQTLYEISRIKSDITKQILDAVKETAIDCNVHSRNSKEGLVCFNFGSTTSDKFSFTPSISNEQQDSVRMGLNQETIKWSAKEITINGMKFALRDDSDKLYDYDSYLFALENPGAKPRLLAEVQRDDTGKIIGAKVVKV